MQEAQILVKKEDLTVYDKVSSKIFAGGLPKVTLLFGATPYANAGAVLVHIPSGVRTAWHTHPAKFTLAQRTAKNNVDKAFK